MVATEVGVETALVYVVGVTGVDVAALERVSVL